jgi:peptidoglycan/LPS O-acetylase OafA/YrhL
VARAQKPMITTHQKTDADLVPPDRLPYMQGIDGLRAIAVMAVLFYHGDFTWARGGYLGVEVFFVISGYLITSLLLVEWLRTGTIGIKSFWIRRARRLLPAVFLLLGVVSLASMLLFRDTLYRMLGDVVAATGYVTNWFLIVNDVSYFETFGRPPLLQHLWSLSVEEQFYVLWPLIFTVGMLFFRGRSQKATIRSFLWMTVVGIIASTVLMALLFTPYEDPSRVYYGTDTRAAGILVGVALSLVWMPWRLPKTLNERATRTLNVIGVGALAGLIVILGTLDEFSPFLYRGGFLVTSVVTAVAIAITVLPAASLGTWLENPAMKWIGTRSYGIYLWHWPIFMVLRQGFDVPWGQIPTFIVRLALTFAVAEVSYRYVESPIRHLGFRQWMTNIRRIFGISTLRGGSAVAATALALVVVLFGGLVWGSVRGLQPAVIASPSGSGTVSGAVVEADIDQPATAGALTDDQAQGESIGVADEPTTTGADGTQPSTTRVSETPEDVSTGENSPPAEGTPATTTLPPASAAQLSSVTLIGDSVLAGADAVVLATLPNDVDIQASVNRQFKHADDVANDLAGAGFLGEVVVIHLGTNGAFSAETFDEVMGSLVNTERVIVLTAKVPRRWESNVNSAIAAGAQRWPDVEIIDWHTIAGAHPEWFNDDKVHLNRTGMQAYADLLDSTINT